jgi:hypothetical protein
MPIEHAYNDFECDICHKRPFKLRTYAEACELSHMVVYVPIHRDDLQHLLMFLTAPSEENLQLIPKRLLEELWKYSKIKGEPHDMSYLLAGHPRRPDDEE